MDVISRVFNYEFTGLMNEVFGELHVNSILAVLNIPGMSKIGVKEREREIGLTLEKMAENSCTKNLQDKVTR